MYRAAYDACDWLAIVYRDNLVSTLHRYDPEDITKLIPMYYTEIRPKVLHLTEKIVPIREKKDVDGRNDNNVNEEELFSNLKNYMEIILELHKEERKIFPCIPELEKMRKKRTGRKILSIIKTITPWVLAVVGWTLAIMK